MMLKPFFLLFLLTFSFCARAETPDVVIMLDVDGTLLKEGDKAYKAEANAQTITYKPSPGARILQLPAHFTELPGGALESTMAVRPGMETFFEKMAPQIAAGKVRIVLTSNGDYSRTQAIQEQIKVGGKTLKEWGVQTADPKTFRSAVEGKDVVQFRTSQGLAATTRVVAIDDNARAIERAGPHDVVHPVPNWDVVAVEMYLGGDPVPKGAEHKAAFGDITAKVEKLLTATVGCGLGDLVAKGAVDTK